MRENTSAALSNRFWKALTMIASAWIVPAAYPQSLSIRHDSFESGTILSAIWHPADTGGCNAAVQADKASDGTHYLRSTLTAAPDGGNYRCELRVRDIDDPANGFIKEGDTVYYGISYRIPAATAYDPMVGDTLTQWFQNPDIGGGGCHQVIKLQNNVMLWHNHNCGGVGGPDVNLITSVPKDTWIRICQKAKWTTHNDGEIKVWVNPASENSTPAKSYSGRTLIDGWTALGRFKIGLYKPEWRTTRPPSNMTAMSPRIFEHDDIRVGKSFADACGGGSDPSEPPNAIPNPPISVAVE
jgi:Polysaccharide lyase